jgi:putative sigma-54 modulation protein
MNLSITGHHVDVTEALKSYATEKLEKVGRHFENVTDIHVVLSVEKLRQKAEATLNLSGGKLFADAVDEDMYAALDRLTDKLDRQVIKHKEKLKNHHKKDKFVG